MAVSVRVGCPERIALSAIIGKNLGVLCQPCLLSAPPMLIFIRFTIVALLFRIFLLSSRSADEKVPQGQWLVGVSDLTAHRPATVWLAVQPMASAKSVSVTVATPNDTTISVSQPGNAACRHNP